MKQKGLSEIYLIIYQIIKVASSLMKPSRQFSNTLIRMDLKQSIRPKCIPLLLNYVSLYLKMWEEF